MDSCFYQELVIRCIVPIGTVKVSEAEEDNIPITVYGKSLIGKHYLLMRFHKIMFFNVSVFSVRNAKQ